MPDAPRKYFLTTPIYYVNARPHIGHAYTTIVADVLARRHRLLGPLAAKGELPDTFFLTGTDEHGQKIERSAQAAGIAPQQFADQVSASFRGLWDRMGITYDDFIRTTEPRHHRAVAKLFRTLEQNGYIYLDSYTGQYCVSEETFVEGPPGTIGPDGRPTETVTEENYFFKLSEFQQPLIEKIESGELAIEPEARRNEVLSFLRGGLRDLSISRSSFTWGVPVPGNEKHVIYVWLDALANYMTAVGYGDDSPEGQAMFARYWPADLHIVGKEIIRFHCVYWPAFLMAAGLALPKKVVAHGWLLFEESKMSKSRGNIVRTETILDAFGPLCPPSPPVPDLSSSRSDAEGSALALPSPATKQQQDLFAADILRYFLLREIPFGQDGSFSFDAMITRYNADLANGYGNLVSRTLSMIERYFDGIVPDPHADTQPEFMITRLLYHMRYFDDSDPDEHTDEQAYDPFDDFDLTPLIEACDFSGALTHISRLVATTDAFLTKQSPWKFRRDMEPVAIQRWQAAILFSAYEDVRILTLLLHPILPYATTRVWQQLGLDPAELTTNNSNLTTLSWGGLKPGTKLGPLSPIFPRADKGLAQIMADMESSNTPSIPQDKSVESVESVVSPSFDPAAGPRTSTFVEPSPGDQVAGSAAITTERHTTPPHTEAASGIFAHQPSDASPQIAIDDFAKVELRVAKVIVAERIPKADKLLRLEVDLGYEKRQILSGIAEWYTPEELIGRRIVVITNLAPRKMRGLESHGMLLAASAAEGGKPALATFEEKDELPLGSRLK